MYLSPLKIAFSTIILSIIVSIWIYRIRISLFPACRVTISFSSGIIVLFCYCTLLINYETKKYKISINYTILAALLIILNNTNIIEIIKTRRNKKIVSISFSPILIIRIIIVLISIVCINKTINNLNKAIRESY